VRAERLLAAALLATLLAGARPAQAYCRTTTCGPGECASDPACEHCLVGGLPLYWSGGCVSFSVHDAGSPRIGIDGASLRALVTNAASIWIGVDCGGATPGIAVYDLGLTSCGSASFSEQGPNANVWMFRNEEWPHASSQLALTTVTFGAETGRLYDADVEINSAQNELTVGDGAVVWDLESIIVHEMGHFFGLAHSCVPGATMRPSFQQGDTSLRTLTNDDALALCSAHPPGSATPSCDPTPRNGLATGCSGSGGSAAGSSSSGGSYGTQQSAAEPKGCSCGVPHQRGGTTWLFGVALMAALGSRRAQPTTREVAQSLR
jgi:hypothetical protein